MKIRYTSVYIIALAAALPSDELDVVKRDVAYCEWLRQWFDVGLNNMGANLANLVRDVNSDRNKIVRLFTIKILTLHPYLTDVMTCVRLLV